MLLGVSLCMPLLGSCCGCFYEHEKMKTKRVRKKMITGPFANMVETNREG
jgi:hypothetical protein